MGAFFALVAPLPDRFRKNIILFIKENPLFGQIGLALKFTFFFIFILFVDSVNRVYRVQQEFNLENTGNGVATGAVAFDRNEVQARRFYAQRNMYLCGFTLFLSLILLRVSGLVLELADAREALAAGAGTGGSSTEVKKLKETIRKQDLDIEHLKKQSKGLSDEYYKVSDELNEKNGVLPGDKKND